jgi:hypothetical protein
MNIVWDEFTEELEAENKRLRAALAVIAADPTTPDGKFAKHVLEGGTWGEWDDANGE